MACEVCFVLFSMSFRRHGCSVVTTKGARLLQRQLQLACEAVAVLDPFCCYSVSLSVEALPGLVMGDLYSVVVVLAQFLLLLVVARRPGSNRWWQQRQQRVSPPHPRW